jgi:beta-1,4-mannooligosaccharide/beta-1,4-mannosyl-N-acetylglucosamine phosphorylase
MLKRYSKTPIISPKDIVSSHPEMIDVSSVFNPGGIQFGNKILLLLRVQNRGRETLTIKATSDDGAHFSIDDQPIKFSGMDNLDETIFHIYDPRITKIENTYFVMAAMDVVGKCLLGLFKTEDFSSLEFLGIKGEGDNRNGVLFPEKINGKYASFDRPNKSLLEGGVTTGNAIWYSESDDLKKWDSKQLVMRGRLHYWDENIGAGPPPVKTHKGWLMVYHGISMHYQPISQAGVVLLDLAEPWKVISRGRYNILEPREIWEMAGQVPNVVFPTGLIVDSMDDSGFTNPSSNIKLYYGAADTHIGLATSTVQELIDACFA